MNKLVRCTDKREAQGIACLICDSRDARSLYTYWYNEQRCDIYRCCGCGHLFIHPQPLAVLDSRNMDTIEDAEFFGNAFLKQLHEKLILNREIKAISRFIDNQQPTLLDIGCGTGWTTQVWKKNGFNVFGIEPSEVRGRFCRDTYGIEVFCGHIEDYKTERKFDVIIMRHLLEHIGEPLDVLKRVKAWLKQDGILLIVIPNINSIGRFIFKENWEWVLPWHLHFYTPQTLVRLLEKAGYEKLSIYQTPSPLWYPNSFKKALGPQSRLGQFLNSTPTVFSLLPFLPLMTLGVIFNLNDNMTLFSRPR